MLHRKWDFLYGPSSYLLVGVNYVPPRPIGSFMLEKDVEEELRVAEVGGWQVKKIEISFPVPAGKVKQTMSFKKGRLCSLLYFVRWHYK